jgi:predicted Fe-Mo cluster-binding NifX family protein
MHIAIAQYKGAVSGAYELSDAVSIYGIDLVGSKVVEVGLFPFPGVASARTWLIEKGVVSLLVGTIDPDNAESLADKGINVFMFADDMSPADNAERVLRLTKKKMESNRLN